MATLPIRVFGDPVLRAVSTPVMEINGRIKKLVDDMIETMHNSNGVGLAANQVGVLQRIIVIQLPDDEGPRVFINPELTKQEGERDVEEGCLSIPGYRGLVRRSVKVKAKGLDRKGKVVRVNAEELLAQALEHEIDHLNGTLYIDHLVDRDKLWKEGAEAAPPPQEQKETEEMPVEAPLHRIMIGTRLQSPPLVTTHPFALNSEPVSGCPTPSRDAPDI